jgi:hypothetical protein
MPWLLPSLDCPLMDVDVVSSSSVTVCVCVCVCVVNILAVT